MPHPIDALIRLVEKSELPGSKDEKHFVIDAKNRPATTWSLGLRRHYLVNSRKTANRTGLPIRLASLSGSLDIDASYQVRCAPGGEELLAVAVAAASSPQEALDAFISDQLERFAYDVGMGRVVEDFANSSTQFSEKLSVELRQSFGLLIELRLAPGTKPIDAKPVGPIILQVRPHDADLSLDIEFEAVLRVDPRHVARAHLKESELEPLAQAVVRQAREFLSQIVSLHELFTDLNGQVLKRFVDGVSALLSEHGRELAAPAFRCDFRKQPTLRAALDAPEQLHIPFKYEHPSHPTTIRIQASLKLKPFDVARLVRARVTSLESWAEDAVQKASRNLLFELSYEVFCTRFEQTKLDLKKAMGDAAEQIGYHLDHFYSVTDHQIDELLRGVELGPIEDAFVVRSEKQLKVRLRLSARVRMRGGNLEKVMGKVVRNETVQKDMEGSLRSVAARFLRKLSLQQFYVYFEVPGDNEERSQRQLLEQELRNELDDSYGADLVEFDAVRLETEVHALFDRLRRETVLVSLEVRPPQHPAERFDLEFQIQGVLPQKWDTFQATMPEVPQIAAAVKRHLETELSAFPGEVLLTQSKALSDFAAKRATLRVEESFGLQIMFLTFHRLPNSWEVSVGKEIEAARNSEVAKVRDGRVLSEEQEKLQQGVNLERIKSLFVEEHKYREQANEARAADDEERAKVLDGIADQVAQERTELMKQGQSAAHRSLELAGTLTFGKSAFSPLLSLADGAKLLESTSKNTPPEPPPSTTPDEPSKARDV